ncbi:MAG: tRNA (guanosine(37)-N1)-methyltransferase TrmD [Deltaproteobacteria bacterium]|jgi:tRNA (guanine37-N1)-methyltransferase|nr:tRNA (guanosine(37)-N1)-methyltransferase TrmD [Deltaproteobacteria bacterium]
MKFNFITLFPELIEASLKGGVVGQAIHKNIISCEFFNPRSVATDVHRTVDSISYGGIDGMVLKPEIMHKALESFNKSNQSDSKIIKTLYLSPQGKTFNQHHVKNLLNYDEITFICGRYAGIDQRFIIHNKIEEISIGDFVLSGGELPALVIMDAISRQVPGVLGNSQSSIKDSFYDNLLEAPCFTRPQKWEELEVPEVLLSGHHQKIEEWKEKISLLITLKKRPDLLQDFFTKKQVHFINGKTFGISELKIFYQQMSEKEKVVCGIQDMIFEAR